jgi:hypothetical protein
MQDSFQPRKTLLKIFEQVWYTLKCGPLKNYECRTKFLTVGKIMLPNFYNFYTSGAENSCRELAAVCGVGGGGIF